LPLKNNKFISKKEVVFYSLVLVMCIFGTAKGATIEELQTNISTKQKEAETLEAEIVRLDSEIQKTQSTGQSLKNEIKIIDDNRKQIETKIKLTANKISSATNKISKLEKNIGEKGDKIFSGKASLAESMRLIHELSSSSIVEYLLSEENLSGFWDSTDKLEQLQAGITKNVQDLETTKAELETNKKALDKEKKNLIILKSRQEDEKKIADQAKKEKDTLLAATKSKESNYKQLLSEAAQKKAAVEKEILSYESQLKITIDPNSYPTAGTKTLSWPLNSVFITQYFGNTTFAQKNQILYSGLGHNGIDLRASMGTPVYAASEGKVIGSGDTDVTCKKASYGRWVLIQHPSGLSTLYGHLSLIKTYENQNVERGDLIGYSGNTGYTTGPHLHFSVFASAGVKIDHVQSKVPGCGVYWLPRASFNAYLNPLSYL
jgi:murein DD-endopeptidase MepM/ murein hydrolase activator NlpD